MKHLSPEKTIQNTILIVDDSPVNTKLLGKILTQRGGYVVETAYSGSEALSIVEDKIPDLILLDIIMPGMDGFEVCQALKSSAKTKNIPIIFISAQDDESSRIRTFEIGGVDYIAKPINYGEVLARVKTHLTLHDIQEQLRQTNSMLEKRVAERTSELAQLNIALKRFVPQDFLRLLNKETIIDITLGDHIQIDMAIMFVDIRSFTAFSETMTPRENFDFINDYLREVTPVIMDNFGFIDKYIGDAILALFENGEHALKAAISMRQRLHLHNISRTKEGLLPILTGTGIHSGTTMLGIIGKKERMQSTVISDAVNLASRLQDLTKIFGAAIIISSEVLLQIEDILEYEYRFIGRLQVKGKKKPVSIFEVFNGDPKEVQKLKCVTKSIFEEAMFLYYAETFIKAIELFERVLQKNPHDVTAQYYRKRSLHFSEHGVPDSWISNIA